jgi:hypothetical protein
MTTPKLTPIAPLLLPSKLKAAINGYRWLSMAIDGYRWLSPDTEAAALTKTPKY